MVNALNDPYAKNPKLDLRLGLGLWLGLGLGLGLRVRSRVRVHPGVASWFGSRNVTSSKNI